MQAREALVRSKLGGRYEKDEKKGVGRGAPNGERFLMVQYRLLRLPNTLGFFVLRSRHGFIRGTS